MKELDELNIALELVLTKLQQIPAEDSASDDLVSNLQLLVEERQQLLSQLTADVEPANADYLQRQLSLTQDFARRASVIMADRQALLQLGSRNKRKIGVYQSIDSNR